MKKSRRKLGAAFKTKVALEALKDRQSLQELAEKFAVHPNQIGLWKKEFLENAQNAFGGAQSDAKKIEEKMDELYREIGQLQVENNWLKKKLL
jgi:transposase